MKLKYFIYIDVSIKSESRFIMAFLAAMVQKQSFMAKKNTCEFQLMLNSNTLQNITSQLNTLSAIKDKSSDQEAALAELKNYEDYYESEGDNLESQLTFINGQIDALGSLVSSNIEKDTTWWAVSG